VRKKGKSVRRLVRGTQIDDRQHHEDERLQCNYEDVKNGPEEMQGQLV
jgi:hypothetical protein